MPIAEEYGKLKRLWKDAPWYVRVSLGLSFFLNVSAIAALSDRIFAWRGFIRDGADFYTDWIVAPIQALGLSVGMDWSEMDINALIILLFTLTPALIVSKQSLATLTAIGITAACAFLLGFFDEKNQSPWIAPWATPWIEWAIGLLPFGLGLAESTALFGLCIWTLWYLLAWAGEDQVSMLVLMLPAVAAFCLVLVIGAINAGLTRPIG